MRSNSLLWVAICHNFDSLGLFITPHHLHHLFYRRLNRLGRFIGFFRLHLNIFYLWHNIFILFLFLDIFYWFFNIFYCLFRWFGQFLCIYTRVQQIKIIVQVIPKSMTFSWRLCPLNIFYGLYFLEIFDFGQIGMEIIHTIIYLTLSHHLQLTIF